MTSDVANTSGIRPLDMKVLVKPDDPTKVTMKGIIIPESSVQSEKYAITKGTLIAVGENAFRDWGSDTPRPTIGDRVLTAKYAGLNISEKESADGTAYRLCNDEDIIARLEQ